MAIAGWVGALDRERMHRVLDGASTVEELQALHDHDDEPAPVHNDLAVVHKATA